MGLKRLGLIGTHFTMRGNFYPDVFSRQGMTIVASGVGAGLLIALSLTRFMSSLLFGVGAANAFTFAAVSILLLTVALAACLIPARRAMHAEPAVVLRNE